MKTIVKQIATVTFIALILLVGNVSAKGTETKASSHETVETTLQVESWMTNETVWNTNSLNIIEFSEETEANLEVERWMTNADTWNLSNNFVEEVENEMELEDWMTNDETWNTVQNETEAELMVEPWMTDNNIWE